MSEAAAAAGTAGGAIRRYFDRLMELSPVEGTYYGLHQHDGRLPEGGPDEARDRLRLLDELEAGLAATGGGDLDAEVARYYAGLARFQLQEVRLWARMADAPDVVGTALFLLFARDFAPLDQRLESIASRLEAVPAYLRASRERLRQPVALWNAIAAESARQLPSLFDAVVAAAPEGALRRRLEAAAVRASEAAESCARWLEDVVVPAADGTWALGEEPLARLLGLRRLPDPPEAIRELGRRHLAEALEERVALLAEHWPGRTPDQATAEVRALHAPSFEAALDEYRAVIARCRAFVGERLATLPPDEELRVEETPAFLRPVLPFAAYEPPAAFDRRQLGIYIVTPQPGELGEHNHAAILNTSVHEGYPGHHLHFASATRHPAPARLLGLEHAVELVEGWAHYCEQLMAEHGFLAGPEVRLVQLNDLIWRACRIVIDVELSSGRMSFEEAVAMLEREAAMSPAAARAEVRRYTYTPGYQLSYLYGKHLLLGLRERRRAAEGARFDLRGFHDTLLSAGGVPASLWDRLFPGPTA